GLKELPELYDSVHAFCRLGSSEALSRPDRGMYTLNEHVCANRISLFSAPPGGWNDHSAVEESSSPGAFHNQSQPVSRECERAKRDSRRDLRRCQAAQARSSRLRRQLVH